MGPSANHTKRGWRTHSVESSLPGRPVVAVDPSNAGAAVHGHITNDGLLVLADTKPVVVDVDQLLLNAGPLEVTVSRPAAGSLAAAGNGNFVELFMPCPNDACNHSRAMHDPPAIPDAAPTCRADRCGCAPEDLANEEWS